MLVHRFFNGSSLAKILLWQLRVGLGKNGTILLHQVK